jgi:hypothetical protein
MQEQVGVSNRLACGRPALHVLARYSMAVLIAMLFANCGGPSRIDVFLECMSPDRTVVAVLWAEAGGGAAGWSQQLVSIQPSDVPITRTPDRRKGDEAPVLAVSSGEAYAFKWVGNDRLLINVTYSKRAAVYSKADSRTLKGGRLVHITYREVEAERHTYSQPQVKCESESVLIENPTPKRIK